jgi:hypothetical protein
MGRWMVDGWRSEWKTHDQLVEELNTLKAVLRRRWKKASAPRKPKIAAKMLSEFHALGDDAALGAALAAIAWQDKIVVRPTGRAPLGRAFLRIVVKLSYKRAAAIATAIEKVGGPKGAAKKIADNHGFDSTVWKSATPKARKKAAERLSSKFKRPTGRKLSKPKSK